MKISTEKSKVMVAGKNITGKVSIKVKDDILNHDEQN